jgi:pyruvate,water dikinase
VLISDGEVVDGAYRSDGLPASVLVDLSVSAGTVEGTARFVSDMAEAKQGPGDVQVTV